MQSHGLSKQKLGAILDPSLTTPQGRIKKVNRLLSPNNPKIEMEDIQTMSQYFDQPIEWFYTDASTPPINNTPAHLHRSGTPMVPFLGAVSDAAALSDNPEVEDYFTYPFTDTPLAQTYCVRMIGASMQGMIPHGAYIFVQTVDSTTDLPAGTPVIYQIKKSLPHIALWHPNADGTITLQSPNPQFTPLIAKPDVLQILGQVKKIFTHI